MSAPADVSSARGARRWRSGALAALAFMWLAAPAGAEPGARQVPLPPGLASVWRVDGRKVDAYGGAWSLAAFSTDGELVGISDDGGTRVYRASDGRLVRMFPAPYSTGQFAYSLAISSTGLVALGRVGGVDVHALDAAGRAAEVLLRRRVRARVGARVLAERRLARLASRARRARSDAGARQRRRPARGRSQRASSKRRPLAPA